MASTTFPHADWVLLGLSAILSAAAWIGPASRAQSIAGIWFPGCFFGLALGLLHLDAGELILSLGILSGVSFATAFQVALQIHRLEVFSLFSPLSRAQRLRNRGVEALSGAVAGAVGASMVSVALKVLAGVDIVSQFEVREVAVGAICGVLFFQLGHVGLPNWLAAHVAFLFWQLPVGLFLGASLALAPVSDRSLLIGNQLRMFLSGPTIQLIGLVGSIASVVSLLRQRSEPMRSQPPEV